MEILVEILRRESGEDDGFWQKFRYEFQDPSVTAATALTRLNERENLRDTDGKPARPVRWECGCLQKKCGACAMVINGRPGLACDARLVRYRKGLRLEPLKKFPVIADLIVDRSALYQALEDLRVWREHPAAGAEGALPAVYEASRCLQCGCCLEVCPNYAAGGRFSGMSAAVSMARLLALSPEDEKRRRIYRERLFEGCGKSLSCREVCPAGIDVDGLLARSNRLLWRLAVTGENGPFRKVTKKNEGT